jgi:tRNA modification GTPase
MSGETIVAVSTPPGVAALAVLRLSGPESRRIVDELAAQPVFWQPRQATYRVLQEQGQVLDDVVLTFFAAPHSFTGEDVVEVSCHGNPRIAEAILQACLTRGARAARPGEFTQRAYLNDKLSLTQAEGLLDLLYAPTERAMASARAMKEGRLGEALGRVRAELVDLLSHLEASLDFAEEGIEPRLGKDFAARVGAVQEELVGLLQSAPLGRILQQGALVVIFGEPNVGKSSLLNALLREDRALVAPTPGTTRDWIEVPCQVRGLPLRLVDTAGQREAEDPVEVEGARRGREMMARAELLLEVVEAHRPLTPRTPVENGSVPVLLVANKADLGRDQSLPAEAIAISARSGEGLEALEKKMEEALLGVPERPESPLAINARQKASLTRAAAALARTREALSAELGLEVVSIELREALQELAEVIGATTNEDILTRLFQNFCIGK